MKSDREFSLIFTFVTFGLIFWIIGFLAFDFDIFGVQFQYIDSEVYNTLILPIVTMMATILCQPLTNNTVDLHDPILNKLRKRHPLFAKSIIFGFYFWVGNVFVIALLTLIFPQYDTFSTEVLEVVYSMIYCPICTATATFLYRRNHNRIALTHRIEAFILGGVGIISWIIAFSLRFLWLSEALYVPLFIFIIFPLIIIASILYLQGVYIRYNKNFRAIQDNK